MIKEKVIGVVKSFFSTGKLLKSVNKTFITLIPKSDDSKCTKDFRPISLCNFIYKIITKVMVGRLRVVLPKLISANQFAFLKGRGLLEAVQLANEIMNELKLQDLFAVKVDITKAYDSVRWSYIMKMLTFMNFPPC